MINMLKLNLLLFILFSFQSFAQKKEAVKYFEENTIDLTEKNDYQKFEAISNQIGDARVLLLGEQNHGDGTTMTFKGDLVKYLHKEKGFDLILFESDFFLLQKLLEEGNTDITKTLEPIFSIYSNCSQLSDLFSYIDSAYKTENPLLVSGFDMQKYYYMPEYIKALKEEMNKRQIVIEDTSWFYNTIQHKPIEELDSLIKYVDTINPKDNSLLSQDMICLQQFIKREQKRMNKKTMNAELESLRDSSMAENALWLIKERFPDKKIIVWGHNNHLSRNINFSRFQRSNYYYMGSGLYDALGDELYSITFTAYEGSGKFAVNDIQHVKKTHRNSFEDWNYKKNYQTSFTDFKGLRGKNISFKMKGIFTKPHYNLVWDTVFDGVIYIQTVEPCIKIDKEI